MTLTEAGKPDDIQELLEAAGLAVHQESLVKGRDGEKQVTFDVRGPSEAFRDARADLLERPEVRAILRS